MVDFVSYQIYITLEIEPSDFKNSFLIKADTCFGNEKQFLALRPCKIYLKFISSTSMSWGQKIM